jgi:hypothetical protein
VFAGLIITLALQIVLSILGVGIGAATIDPITERNPAQGLAIGAGIWFLVSGLIALFVGGCVAGHLAGVPRRADGGLHGLITWASATVAAVFLLTTALGGLASGAMGMLGRSVSLLSQNSGQVQQVAQQAQAKLQQQGVNVKQEAQELLPQTGPPSLEAQKAAAELERTQERMFNNEGQVRPQDRQAVASILVARYNMNPEQANRVVIRWEQTAAQAGAQSAQVEQKARQAGQTVAKGTAQTAIWSFLALLLGAAAAYFGGAMGAPKHAVLPSDATTTTTAPAT